MTDLPATITALGTLVAAVAAALIAWRNNRKANDAKQSAEVAADAAHAARVSAEEGRVEVVATKDGVFELGKQLDGRLQELLATTKALARAEGQIEGRAAERAEPTPGDTPKRPRGGTK